MGIFDSFRGAAHPDGEYVGETEFSPETELTGAGSGAERFAGAWAKSVAGQLRVAVILPESFDAAARIADHLRDRHVVLVNLANTPQELTQRVLDFCSGALFVSDGILHKVAEGIFLLLPSGADLLSEPPAEPGVSSR